MSMTWLGKRLLLLLALLLPVLLLLNALGERSGRLYKDGAAQVCENKRQAVRDGRFGYSRGRTNVLFFGTSRILAGIVPAHFDALSGNRTASLNLALPALPVGASYLLLRDWLARNPPPQMVVMELYISRCRACSVVNYYLAQGLDSRRDLVPLMTHLNNKSILLNCLFPFRMYKYFTVQHLSDRLRHPDRLARLRRQSQDLLKQMTANRGYYYIREQAVNPAGQLPEEFAGNPDSPRSGGFDADPFSDPFTEKFFSLCAAHHIRVQLIQPAFRQGQLKPHDAPPEHFTRVMARWGNVCTAPMGWQNKLYPLHLFADPTHLNPNGARCYTETIFAEFNQCFPETPGKNR
jgi:hypothetical protein